MTDADGPVVAEEFYKQLFKPDEEASGSDLCPDISKSAWALHCAVKKLRDSAVPCVRWVPFVHYGL